VANVIHSPKQTAGLHPGGGVVGSDATPHRY
jgi:hypothetical protein